MIIIPVILAVVGLLFAIIAVVFGIFTSSPVIEYAASIPRWATLAFLPLAGILLVITAIEYAVRKPSRSSALPWGLGLISAWLAAWAGNAGAGAVAKKILP